MTSILIKTVSLSNWQCKLLIFDLILQLVHKVGALSSFYLWHRVRCYFPIFLYFGFDTPLPPPPALSSQRLKMKSQQSISSYLNQEDPQLQNDFPHWQDECMLHYLQNCLHLLIPYFFVLIYLHSLCAKVSQQTLQTKDTILPSSSVSAEKSSLNSHFLKVLRVSFFTLWSMSNSLLILTPTFLNCKNNYRTA